MLCYLNQLNDASQTKQICMLQPYLSRLSVCFPVYFYLSVCFWVSLTISSLQFITLYLPVCLSVCSSLSSLSLSLCLSLSLSLSLCLSFSFSLIHTHLFSTYLAVVQLNSDLAWFVWSSSTTRLYRARVTRLGSDKFMCCHTQERATRP